MSLFYCYQHLKSKPLICLNVYTEVTNNIKGNMTDVGTDKIKPFLANYIFKWTFIFKPILLHLSQSPQRQGKQEEKKEWERSEEREQRKALRSDENWQKGGQELTWENNTLYKEDSDIYFFFFSKRCKGEHRAPKHHKSASTGNPFLLAELPFYHLPLVTKVCTSEPDFTCPFLLPLLPTGERDMKG